LLQRQVLTSATAYQRLIVVHGRLQGGIITRTLSVLSLLHYGDDLRINGLVAVATEAILASRKVLSIALSNHFTKMVTYELTDPVLMHHGFLGLSEISLDLRLNHLLGCLLTLVIVSKRAAGVGHGHCEPVRQHHLAVQRLCVIKRVLPSR
jgi:hypothetical protein